MNSNIQQSIQQPDLGDLNFEVLKKIRGYLRRMIDAGGSDLHIKANAVVRARINGEIIPLSGEIFSKDDALVFAKELLRTRFPELVEKKELDLVYPFDENTRFRINIFFQMEGISAVFRLIPVKILTVDELLLPEIVHSFAEMERGLVLVTGVTGSGKSTTLAALINEINWKRRKHIITIEDPIEFVHKDRKCIVNQRSIGQDTHTFGSALRAALREDPDIILVGEMRDMETIEIALHAADTGHLVFSTLHTLDAKETVNRIISVFPTGEQNRVRMTLSSVLKGVISQRLIPTVDGKRTAALEILIRTPRIEQLIAENRDIEIPDTIAEGKELYKSQTFDQGILDLYLNGRISREDALAFATSPSDLKLKMEGLSATIDKGKLGVDDGPKEFKEEEFIGLKG
ncbi:MULTISPECIES: PilT/PilU family type 4a pilus ATPase [unclassified Sulfuricurvum]|uniref:type IV pilus twitching motility protein PilT n=1 Tax=unclassified Sulfuricurvum TaxID=2632390 RepID=UPI0002998EF6|nr:MULTISPECIES: PilT/PilU family type 4a pilus ATPase [unclassified Sulfuricurvum]OHD79822.1 MAG: type IV pili twitching motility protein PilT [Sulfuricurvum sp. RIFCSPHIGHO2_02_FULL_43_9]OHD83775.1 MAG: type IV pili twitching motility protein PilT [Sulfuricurvum sp. RIFCSPLOWO2_02_43_6]OHD86596.1 MAG: type IV pili twitching motility protein PilT [Sulfuricurvum sp. RIFCSPLOWO2_02_FULL_43_45]OHD88134.1 MAG: type IV pili twitching motility protein PilT [Sulfuricurvum sp. RIFCSPHIGHO2_12_FULL_44_